MEYIGTHEASEILGCRQSHVASLCRRGDFQTAEQDKKGSPWRILKKEVEQYKKKVKEK